jgi:glycerol-3-phosphate dehydrogenase
MRREEMLARLCEERETLDFLVIGGGATGAGIALDAASRGYAVALVERGDFGSGTSSRSTKLVHGGVRYLEQGNIPLVMDALHERGIMRENAPHLVSDLAFVVPNYEWWESPFYGVGLKLYDLLAGRYGFGASRVLSKEETLERLPNLKTEGLRGGVVYFDGQFDDARLLIHLLMTAVAQGASVVNHCPVEALLSGPDGYVNGARVHDLESGHEYEVRARVVMNATGPFTDNVRRMGSANIQGMIAPSQGVHLVFDHSFLSAQTAILVPHTRDGRVMFAIPWHGHTLVGTTDTPVQTVEEEPRPFDEEIRFILETAGDYLDRPPKREDILSAWAGIRPLVKAGGAGSTAQLSRDHTIHVDPNGLLSVAGGKWTTYRKMAEDAVTQAALLAGLEERDCVTRRLHIYGYHANAKKFGPLAVYGSDATAIEDLVRLDPSLGAQLHPDLPYVEAQVLWAARKEMARSVVDVLSRRLRALTLNARAAVAMAPRVAQLMRAELGRNDAWAEEQLVAFNQLAEAYLPA